LGLEEGPSSPDEMAASKAGRTTMKNGTNSMVYFEDYVAGWLDSSIGDFLRQLPRTSEKLKYALITSLDSDATPSKLLGKSPELKPIAKEAKPLGDGFIVPTSLILKGDATIFYGFDEVWFFPDDKIGAKPKSAWVVGPNRLDQSSLNEFGSWLRTNRCSLALGDGDGLNFIVKARGLVKYLLAYSIFQPEPEWGGEEENGESPPNGAISL
jgi:hypothetical protein